MPPKSPAIQLVDLCTAGAIPSRIEVAAPFMRELAATRHAIEVLYDANEEQWAYAARELLKCVCRAGGAAGFGEEAARFVSACLDFESTQRSFSERMYGLANDPNYAYPTAPKTHSKRRDRYMSIVAGELLKLDRFPGAPLSDLEKRKQFTAALFTFQLEAGFREDVGDVSLSEIFDDIVGMVRSGFALMDEHAPELSTREHIQIMVRAVSHRAYRDIYSSATVRDRQELVNPDELPRLFEGASREYTGIEDEIKLSCNILASIMIDIESQDAWSQVLLVAESEREPFSLSGGESAQIRKTLNENR